MTKHRFNVGDRKEFINSSSNFRYFYRNLHYNLQIISHQIVKYN